MKKTYFILSLFVLIASAITSDAQTGPWSQKASMPGLQRHRAFTFSIGARGYLGCGWNGVTMYQDFWEYDPATNSWTQKADYPPGPRLSAFGFSIGNKGYAGCGLDEFLYAQGDVYEYNPITNSWLTKSMFGGTPIFAASAVVIGNKAYICFGDDWDPMYIRHNDLWEYNSLTDSWTPKTPCPGNPRRDASAFAIGNKAYYGTGSDDFYTELNDFWEYDPTLDSWSAKASFIGSARSQATGFAVNGKGYIGTGGQLDVTDFWEYNATTNSWKGIDDFSGQGRENTMSFVIGNRGYVTCGTSGTNYNDLWEFNPFLITGINDKQNVSSINVFPNPMITSSTVTISQNSFTENMYFELTDIQGRVIKKENIISSSFSLTKDQMISGIYFLTIKNENNIVTVKKLEIL